VRPAHLGSLVAALLLLGSFGCGGPDEAASPKVAPGRSQVISLQAGPPVAGEGAQYTYDLAGNLVRISAAAAAPLAISGFSPASGGPGQVVTVFGAGFSPTPGLNAVSLGSVAATVIAATSSELAFVIPSTSVTGPISVTCGATTAVSASIFTVITEVTVSDFNPKMGQAGTALTIAGLNFDPNPTGNQILVGGGAASVMSASALWIDAAVGVASTSGKVRVTTSAGSGTSAADFFVLPANYWEWDIGFTGRLSPGVATSVAVSSPGLAGLALFDGVAGQYWSLYVSGDTYEGSTQLLVYAPGGAVFFASSVRQGQDKKATLPVLPATGTYTIVVQPAAATPGTLSLAAFQDASAVLQPSVASPLTMAPGQNGRYSYAANAGDVLGLACSAFGTTPAGGSVVMAVLRAT
jgi:hypothetical protein